jgi:hypothetical protein
MKLPSLSSDVEGECTVMCMSLGGKGMWKVGISRMRAMRHRYNASQTLFNYRLKYIISDNFCNASRCVMERSYNFPAPGRICMTHRQALAATAAKIINTTLRLYKVHDSNLWVARTVGNFRNNCTIVLKIQHLVG